MRYSSFRFSVPFLFSLVAGCVPTVAPPPPTPTVTPSACDGVTCSGQGTCNVVGEQASCTCDSGYHLPSGGDSTTCVPQCGDGVVTSAEACDLGAANIAGAYGNEGNCTTSCQPASYCGDGTKDSGEVCDLGAANIAGAYGDEGDCTASCQPASFCGDGTKDSGEACDLGDANIVGTYGVAGDCTQSCTVASYCGDDTQDSGEACDDGASNVAPGTGSLGQCLTSCILLVNECGVSDTCNILQACGDAEIGFTCTCPGGTTPVGVSCDFVRDSFDIQGHRGRLGTNPPGNTMSSFIAGVLIGADTLEGDMRISADGVVVMNHDAALDAACVWAGSSSAPASRIVVELTAAEIGQFDCEPSTGGIQSPATLSELLTLATATNVDFSLEMKTNGQVSTYMDAILASQSACSGCLQNRVILQSFTHVDLETAKTAYFETAPNNFSFRAAALGPEASTLASKPYVDIYSPSFTAVTPADVLTAHALGMEVIPYTVNTLPEMRAMLSMGVDGMITDFPDLLALARETFDAGELVPVGGIGNLLSNGGAERQPVTANGWVQDSGSWGVARGDDAGLIRTHSGGNFFWPGPTGPTGELHQDVSMLRFANWLSNGDREAVFIGYIASWVGDVDTAQVVIEARDGLGTVLSTRSSTASSANAWTRVELRLPLLPATATVRVRLIGVRVEFTDNNAYFDDLGLYLNLLRNGSAEVQPVTTTGWIVDGAPGWDVDRGDDAGNIGTHGGNSFFWPGPSDAGALRQTIDFALEPRRFSNGDQMVQLLGWVASSSSDDETSLVELTAWDANGNRVADTSTALLNVDAWTPVTLALLPPPGTVTLRVSLSGTVGSLPGIDAYFDDLALILPDGGTPNVLINGGAESQPVTSNGWTQATGDWTIARGDDAGGIGTHGGSNFFWPGQSAAGELYQDVALPAGRLAEPGDAWVALEGFVGSWVGDNDTTNIIMEARDGANAVIGSVSSGTTSLNFWRRAGLTLNLPPTTTKVRVRLVGTRVSGMDNNAYFDDLRLFFPLTTLLLNGGAETQPIGSNGWTQDVGDWSVARGNDAGGIGTHGGANFFWAGQSVSGYLIQDVSTAGYAALIAGGTARVALTGHRASWSGDNDSIEVVLEALNALGGQVAVSVVNNPMSPDTWTPFQATLGLPTDTATVRVYFVASRNSGADNNAYVDDVALFIW